MVKPQSLTQTGVGREFDIKWSLILRVTNDYKRKKRKRDVEPEVGESPAPVAADNADGRLCHNTLRCPRQAVSGESTSVKRGPVAGSEDEERARLSGRKASRGQTHDKEDILEPKAKVKAKSPRGASRARAHSLSPIWKRTLWVARDPIEEGSSSSADVLVGSALAVSVTVEDVVQTGVSHSVECWNQTFQWYSWIALLQRKQGPRLSEIDQSRSNVECMSREAWQGVGLEMCGLELTEICASALFDEHVMQLGLRTGVAADLVTAWTLETSSSQLRSETPKVLNARPPRPSVSVVQNLKYGSPIPLDTFVARECFQQVHRGGHLTCGHTLKASSWKEQRIRKLTVQPSVVPN